MALNSILPDSTLTPSSTLMFGRAFNGFEDFKEVAPFGDTKAAIQERLKFWQHFAAVVLPAINERNAEYQQGSRKQVDQSRKVVDDKLAVGTRVMALDHTRESKWDPVYEGPYTVVSANQGGTYTLRGADGVLLPRRRTRDTLRIFQTLVPTGGESGNTENSSEVLSNSGTSPLSDVLAEKLDQKVGRKLVEAEKRQAHFLTPRNSTRQMTLRQRKKPALTVQAQTTSSGSKEEKTHFSIEEIVTHEWNADLKTQRFYVKWKGYPSSDNSWVKEKDFDDKAILKKYWKKTNARITSGNQKLLSKLTSDKKPTTRRQLIKTKN
jgi:hypothetical protein